MWEYPPVQSAIHLDRIVLRITESVSRERQYRAQRQTLIRRALEIDDSPLSLEDERLVDSRLSAMRESPDSVISLDEMKRRLRSRFS